LQSSIASLIAPVGRWSVSEPGASGAGPLSSPDVGFVEPMLRRRLSSLARMVLRVAHDCAHDIPDARFVYASRHGELTRTTTMLDALAARDGVSPAVFSMSVLNAVTGLFSMLQKDVAPSTAISAGESSFGYGLLEACLQLEANPGQAVLFVYADEPAPAVYGGVDRPGARAHALGLLLESSARTRVSFSIAGASTSPSSEAQSRAFLRCLEGGAAQWSDGQKNWTWKSQ
jgi:hypothetical protein